MIKAKNIHKSYGNLEVLKGVEVHIKEGEVISIVGESGAGKSTLLQILGTLDTPSSAKKYGTEITLDGESFINMSDRQLSKFRNEKIGFVFQFHQLLPEFTALENVLLPTKISGKNERESMDKAYALFDDLHQLFFDLRDKYNQTFVIVTHNLKLADITDRKLIMKDGLIVN